MTVTHTIPLQSAYYKIFQWQGDSKETFEKSLLAVQILSILFAEEEFTVGTTQYDAWGQKDKVLYQTIHANALTKIADPIAFITAQTNCRLRIALPTDAQIDTTWSIQDTDLKIRAAHFTFAEKAGNINTGWIHPKTPIGLAYEIEIPNLGEVKITVRDGLFAHDLRPVDTLIFGSTLKNWIECENELKDLVFAELQKSGFQAT